MQPAPDLFFPKNAIERNKISRTFLAIFCPLAAISDKISFIRVHFYVALRQLEKPLSTNSLCVCTCLDRISLCCTVWLCHGVWWGKTQMQESMQTLSQNTGLISWNGENRQGTHGNRGNDKTKTGHKTGTYIHRKKQDTGGHNETNKNWNHWTSNKWKLISKTFACKSCVYVADCVNAPTPPDFVAVILSDGYR